MGTGNAFLFLLGSVIAIMLYNNNSNNKNPTKSQWPRAISIYFSFMHLQVSLAKVKIIWTGSSCMFCLCLLHTPLTFLVSVACLHPRHVLLMMMAEVQDAKSHWPKQVMWLNSVSVGILVTIAMEKISLNLRGLSSNNHFIVSHGSSGSGVQERLHWVILAQGHQYSCSLKMLGVGITGGWPIFLGFSTWSSCMGSLGLSQLGDWRAVRQLTRRLRTLAQLFWRTKWKLRCSFWPALEVT